MSLLNNIAARRSAASKLEVSDEIAVGSEARTIHERPPVGSSQSNGFVERAIQDAEGQIRTIKLDFESRIGTKVPSSHDVVPWLIEYAAVLLNRGQVGVDGKTAYERLKGKRANEIGFEFAEGVRFKIKAANGRRGKFTVLWQDGVILGVEALS